METEPNTFGSALSSIHVNKRDSTTTTNNKPNYKKQESNNERTTKSEKRTKKATVKHRSKRTRHIDRAREGETKCKVGSMTVCCWPVFQVITTPMIASQDR